MQTITHELISEEWEKDYPNPKSLKEDLQNIRIVTLSLENKGVPRLGNPVARGNHQVLVKVKLPTRITENERNLLESLASQYTDQNMSKNSGLFSKFFGKES